MQKWANTEGEMGCNYIYIIAHVHHQFASDCL